MAKKLQEDEKKGGHLCASSSLLCVIPDLRRLVSRILYRIPTQTQRDMHFPYWTRVHDRRLVSLPHATSSSGGLSPCDSVQESAHDQVEKLEVLTVSCTAPATLPAASWTAPVTCSSVTL